MRIIIISLTSISILAAIFIYIGIPWIYGRCARLLLKHRAVKSRTLVLTFDDGPSSRLTPAILKILAEYDIKATFFLLGRNIVGQEELVKQIAAQGHDIFSHGYEHLCHWSMFPSRSLRDIVCCWKAIDTALETRRGKYPVRPPYGKLNIVSLLYLLIRRVPIYYWSIVSGDTWVPENRDTRRIASLAQKAGGGVALAHDFDRTDPSAHAMVLESIRSALGMACRNGIQVKSVTELLGDSTRF